jgi:membrane protein required for colicin V production
MEWVDWVIVLVIVLAVLGGLREGFFRSACSLAGLLLGLALASWNYGLVAAWLMFFVRIEAVADVIGFLAIALAVMGLAGIAGQIMSNAVHGMGLGCVDRLAGAAFGFLQGALLVMVVILVALAFYPHAHWLAKARLPRYFFGACHVTARMSPEEMADRIRHGLNVMEDETPQWLHPGKGGV